MDLSQGGIIPGGVSYGSVDMQGILGVHHQAQYSHNLRQQHHIHSHEESSVRSSIHDGFPLTMGNTNTTHCGHTIIIADYSRGDRSNYSATDEDEPSFSEEGIDGRNDANEGKNGLQWQRVKWTDKMVKLLITAVSYLIEDNTSGCGSSGRRRFSVQQKKGKWKSVSKVMEERSYHVSPQQCEDKFNDLNKRYKKLNDMLGRGTSCQVVENPALLDVIDYLTEKEKDDVRKILSSKHLFYQEMCSYHNGNRLHLPHDPALQHSLQLALRNRIVCDDDHLRKHCHDNFDEDDHDMGTDDHGNFEENHASHEHNSGLYGFIRGSTKRVRQGLGYEEDNLRNSLSSHGCSKSSHCPLEIAQVEMNHVQPKIKRTSQSRNLWIESRSLQLEEKRLQIQIERLELEKQHFKWERFNKRRDREWERLKLANERMKLENERMALQLKQRVRVLPSINKLNFQALFSH